ncbi:MAG: hypothetical protein J6J78_02560 [Clostridia bacterium]|nr:hypothetical protein [Clostridia bacterium]
MHKRFPVRRAFALLLALCLLCVSALAEYQDEALTALAGAEGVVEGQMADDGIEWVENTYVAPTINMDADIQLGYVAASTAEINPFNCTERDLVSLNQLVFESVVELDDEMKPQPLLADSWSNQGKKWTFKLRQGVTFHNGAPLTASEVVGSYNRFMMTNELNPYYTRVQMISSMEIVDDLTLVVNSRYSGYVTLYAMTFPVVQGSTLDDRMARGTGPYWYTEYIPGTGVRLEANPLWWKKDPQVHSIAAVNFADSGDALEALQTNQINMLCTQSSNAAVHRKLSDHTSMDYMTTTYEMLVPNLNDDSVMGDVRMRQAVMYAIDRANVAANAYRGMGIQCEVPVNPSSWLYESQSAIYYYSPERALQLIKECGWSDLTNDGKMNKVNGVMLEDLNIRIITYNESTTNIRENAANLIANYLENVGFNVEVVVYSKSRCLQKVKDRAFDLALVGMQFSESPNLAPLLQGGGSLNLNNFKNESMETAIGQLASAQTEEDLKSLYSQIQMIVVERLPVLGLLWRTGTVIASRSLAGLSGLRVGNMLNGIEFMTK